MVSDHANLDFVGAKGTSPIVSSANQDAILMVIPGIIEHTVGIWEHSANIVGQYYPNPIASATRVVMVLYQFKSEIRYQPIHSSDCITVFWSSTTHVWVFGKLCKDRYAQPVSLSRQITPPFILTFADECCRLWSE